MNKFFVLAFFALAVGAMADYPKPAYHAPAPAHHAPVHHAPAPAHHAPAPYGHHGHAAPVVHTYPVHAPHAKCGANLLVGCAPSVAHVPCLPVKEHGYGHAPAHHGYRAPESDAFDQFEE